MLKEHAAGRARGKVGSPLPCAGEGQGEGLLRQHRDWDRGRRLAQNQLTMELGVSVQRLEVLRALEIEVEIVVPGEADATVNLNRVAADLARRFAHEGLGDRGRE